MRGKVLRLRFCLNGARITPAHAGKSADIAGGMPKGTGSPPPMRGKAVLLMYLNADFRITPAHAGKSIYFVFTHTVLQDHPRPCGEKMSLWLRWISAVGSPPPMRGKATRDLINGQIAGITPAHAGKRAG